MGVYIAAVSPWWLSDLVRMQKIVRTALERESNSHLHQIGADLGFGPRMTGAVAMLAVLEREGEAGRQAGASTGDRSATMTRLARRFALTEFECDVLTLALAIEVEPRFASILRAFSIESSASALTVGTAIELCWNGPLGERWLQVFSPSGPLLKYELVELDDHGPLPSRAFRVARSFDLAACNDPPPPIRHAQERGDIRRAAEPCLAWLRACERPGVLLCEGVPGTGRDEIARGLCAALGRAVIPLSAAIPAPLHRGVVRNAIWHDATLCITDVEPGSWPNIARLLASYDVPAIVVVPPRVDFTALGDRAVRVFRIPELDLSTRAAMWKQLFDGNSRAANLDPWSLAARFPVAPQQMATAWLLASSASECEPITASEVEVALHSSAATPVSGVARRLGCPFEIDDLVVSFETRQELELVMAWLRSGARSRTALASGVAPPGLICLFDGPPGTGKTMAAQIIAREAGVDLYHVDLSQIVSKYVGETEKNLSGLFDALESRRAILFFDEADALFGRRTATKDAHDRYANIETSYLLQRIDQYAGVIVLATNMLGNLDAAFLRRIQVIARFQLPSVEERIQLWKRMLPRLHDEQIDIEALGRTFIMSGADIRNTIVTATVLSTDAGERLSLKHLVPAGCRELRKAGRLIDPGSFGPLRPYLRLTPS